VSTDVDALQTLLESVPSYSERVTGYPPGPSDALSALISLPPALDPSRKESIGLWEGDELVAFADVLIGHPGPETAYIGLLIVREGHHGRGLGRALHDAVLARTLTHRAITTMRLGIIDTVASEAEPFWRALGYVPTGERRAYRYDQLSSAVAMWERPIL
jgi:GNAT superfamily N-acetyltransferase